MVTSREQFNVYLSPPPIGFEREFEILLTSEAINFLVDLYLHFQVKVDDLFTARLERKVLLKKNGKIPKFIKSDYHDEDWTVSPVNQRLENRRLDLGDVSPSDYDHFTSALKANVQGVQVDFDDGHCPTWKNQIMGLYNVYRAVRNDIPNVPSISNAPILMLRPRAWNMMEHNMSINGREVPGPLFDFGLLMFHNASILAEYDSGPCFYLSKLESASEAKLWNDIFVWSQLRLRIPHGTIKATILIENVLSSFEMDQILHEMREHSLGLNCGIWDYAASIISKFGDDPSFLIPDRNKYVNTSMPFLKKYMDLVVRTCHRRNAHATGGMIAKLLPAKQSQDYEKIVKFVLKTKLKEILSGMDGFMVYDLGLVEFVNDLWRSSRGPYSNQLKYKGSMERIMEKDLLTLPKGGVTEEGLKHNITVTILFIYNWLCGRGVFAFKGAIEDSATAEISRAQIWQWIRHGALMESKNESVTRSLVFKKASEIHSYLINYYACDNSTEIKLGIAFNIFLEIVNHRDFPEFLTTYLNDAYIFRKLQASL